MTLFRYEAFTNLSYLGVGLLWLLTLVLWRYTPGLLGVAVHSLRSRGRDTGMGYIARFAPINLFRFLVYLVNSLGIGFLSLRLMGLMDALPTNKQDYQEMLILVGAVSLGCYAFLYLRSRLFRALPQPPPRTAPFAAHAGPAPPHTRARYPPAYP